MGALMPKMDTSNRPDPMDLADDDIRAMTDEEARNALYRMAEKIKSVFTYHEEHIEKLYAAISALED
jgi:hypothetical protein